MERMARRWTHGHFIHASTSKSGAGTASGGSPEEEEDDTQLVLRAGLSLGIGRMRWSAQVGEARPPAGTRALPLAIALCWRTELCIPGCQPSARDGRTSSGAFCRSSLKRTSSLALSHSCSFFISFRFGKWAF